MISFSTLHPPDEQGRMAVKIRMSTHLKTRLIHFYPEILI